MNSEQVLSTLFQEEKDQRRRFKNKKFIQNLKISSSLFAILGGLLLALNTKISGYGFIFLALSSGQLVLSSFQGKDKILLFYSLSLFLCVDCVGIYRWLLS